MFCHDCGVTKTASAFSRNQRIRSGSKSCVDCVLANGGRIQNNQRVTGYATWKPKLAAARKKQYSSDENESTFKHIKEKDMTANLAVLELERQAAEKKLRMKEEQIQALKRQSAIQCFFKIIDPNDAVQQIYDRAEIQAVIAEQIKDPLYLFNNVKLSYL